MGHEPPIAKGAALLANHIPALDGLRFVAAYIVFVSHFSNETNLFGKLLGDGGGQIGVMLFFLLSGFLLGHLYLATPFSGANIKRYLINRLARVAPLYYLVVLASFALTVCGYPAAIYPIDSTSLARHIFLAKGDGILWTIPVEMQFYAVFICIWFACQRFGNGAVAVMAALILVALFFYPMIQLVPWQLQKSCHFFLGGVLIARAVFSTRSPLAVGASNRILADAGFLMSLVLMFLSYPQVYKKLFGVELMAAGWGEMKVFVVCALVLITAIHSRIAAMVLGGPWSAAAGALSYSVYLLHMPIIMGLKSALGSDDLLQLFVASNVAVFAVAGISHAVIEGPARRFVRRWSS